MAIHNQGRHWCIVISRQLFRYQFRGAANKNDLESTLKLIEAEDRVRGIVSEESLDFAFKLFLNHRKSRDDFAVFLDNLKQRSIEIPPGYEPSRSELTNEKIDEADISWGIKNKADALIFVYPGTIANWEREDIVAWTLNSFKNRLDLERDLNQYSIPDTEEFTETTVDTTVSPNNDAPEEYNTIEENSQSYNPQKINKIRSFLRNFAKKLFKHSVSAVISFNEGKGEIISYRVGAYSTLYSQAEPLIISTFVQTSIPQVGNFIQKTTNTQNLSQLPRIDLLVDINNRQVINSNGLQLKINNSKKRDLLIPVNEFSRISTTTPENSLTSTPTIERDNSQSIASQPALSEVTENLEQFEQSTLPETFDIVSITVENSNTLIFNDETTNELEVVLEKESDSMPEEQTSIEFKQQSKSKSQEENLSENNDASANDSENNSQKLEEDVSINNDNSNLDIPIEPEPKEVNEEENLTESDSDPSKVDDSITPEKLVIIEASKSENNEEETDMEPEQESFYFSEKEVNLPENNDNSESEEKIIEVSDAPDNDVNLDVIYTDDQLDSSIIRIEAEDLLLSNYRVEERPEMVASDGKVITLLQPGAPEDRPLVGTASVLVGDFINAPGTYDLNIGFYDEFDGNGQLQILVDGLLVETIELDNSPGDGIATARNFNTQTISELNLTTGSTITIQGFVNDEEYARLDYIELIPTSSSFDSQHPDSSWL
ncbi:MAG: hypothetical protein F6K36_02435 [Symploca sp. SIO3C6]|nr:hypothetical protein [Symploca sp. SIO3C6]